MCLEVVSKLNETFSRACAPLIRMNTLFNVFEVQTRCYLNLSFKQQEAYIHITSAAVMRIWIRSVRRILTFAHLTYSVRYAYLPTYVQYE